MVRGSATVTGSGTAFAASDVGRQFQVSNKAPVYSISAYASATSITLDRVYGNETVGSGLAYRVLDAYVTCPADFKSFIVVYDPKQNWRLRHFMTQDDISRVDPARTSSGTPWALVDRRRSTLTATSGRAQYELWPYSTSKRNYNYFYQQSVADLTNDTDTVAESIHGDVVVLGARADLTMWPGTIERPNPMYDQTGRTYRVWEAQYEMQVAELEFLRSNQAAQKAMSENYVGLPY